jgi:alcohol dehydrogenase class IV
MDPVKMDPWGFVSAGWKANGIGEPSIAMGKSQKTILHIGAISELENCIREFSVRSLFFVVDISAYQHCGCMSNVEDVIGQFPIARFSGFEPNPKLGDIENGVALFRDFSPDLVLALGGGSAIDVAKLIGLMAKQTSSPRDLILGLAPIQEDAAPMIAIPTTSGTGSEATHFSVVYVDGEKHSVAHPSSLPDVALIDPALTTSLPKSITASTGLDAFCQAIESLWAVGSTDESRDYAMRALLLVWGNLVKAVQTPTLESRLAMSQGAHLAGKAINIGKTTSSHALSYFVTSRYGIPHGAAVALTISDMLVYNSQVSQEDCADPRGVPFVRNRISEIMDALGCNTVEKACEAIRDFIRRVGCPASYYEAGIRERTEIAQIVASVNVERMSNNPRGSTVESLVKTLSR